VCFKVEATYNNIIYCNNEDKDTKFCKKAKHIVIHVVHAFLSEQCYSHGTLKISSLEHYGLHHKLMVSTSQECSFKTANESVSTSNLLLHDKIDCEDEIDGNKKELAISYYIGAISYLFVLLPSAIQWFFIFTCLIYLDHALIQRKRRLVHASYRTLLTNYRGIIIVHHASYRNTNIVPDQKKILSLFQRS
jgi:hypothetical protein